MVMTIWNTLVWMPVVAPNEKWRLTLTRLSNPGMHPIYTLQSHFQNHKHISTDRNENEILFFSFFFWKTICIIWSHMFFFFFSRIFAHIHIFLFKVRQNTLHIGSRWKRSTEKGIHLHILFAHRNKGKKCFVCFQFRRY